MFNLRRRCHLKDASDTAYCHARLVSMRLRWILGGVEDDQEYGSSRIMLCLTAAATMRHSSHHSGKRHFNCQPFVDCAAASHVK